MKYSLLAVFGKALLVLLLWPRPSGAAPVLELSAGPGRLAVVSWASVQLDYRPASVDADGLWQLEIKDLQAGSAVPRLDVRMRCTRFSWSEYGPDCDAASLTLTMEGRDAFRFDGVQVQSSPSGGYRVLWRQGETVAELLWAKADDAASLTLEVQRFDLASLPTALYAAWGMDMLAGTLSGVLTLEQGSLSGSVEWLDGALDGFDGRVAAEGLALAVDGRVGPLPQIAAGDFSVRQSGGELLLGSVYLPPPDAPVELAVELDWSAPDLLSIRRWSIVDPGSLSAFGTAELAQAESGWALKSMRLLELQLELARFWGRWMEGPAAAAGFAGLEVDGDISGSLDWIDDTVRAADLAIRDLSVEDPRQRLALYGFSAALDGERGAVGADLGWDAARLWGLPLGPAALSLHADAVGFRLLAPFEVPVLDGALAIDSLAWLNLPELPSQLVLDARIQPISLDLLTRELGLIELGGTLAGRFPGVEYQDERLAFTGGIIVDVFSGQIRIDDLEVERPFGSLPALAAQVQLERLDLLELTGAFDFGRMEGRLSGWMRDLRLLDWRLVAMDTRVFTHEDVSRRRISQRAVDNLSSLGGAGGALLSGTLLRVFDDFPYRRVGLACRLSNNICYIDGVAPHDSGGFLIVEGRGLPRLDVVGHRRLVDWPQLLRQLDAMREQAGSTD